ncbi:SCO1664 family protein [Streptomyces sp. HB2AG]|uniref:SCO1664 family protein n=1 Tax=Streptomyces sp. HB2AG TaxID=2983400 RepID=UPI0022AAF710|nr:SCO1664 family protein [Streptomyces sp. HB2AG]MCZ2525824.1 SCO1664 family protein [Streptomyces sp. HB2AG]
MPAPERVPAGGLTPAGTAAGADHDAAAPGREPRAAGGTGPDPHELLRRGELEVRGRLHASSNSALYCEARLDGAEAACVYKPVAGERPLWDFPDGTLARREVAAHLVSEATGWDLIPPTVLRDGPYGEGMCQLWIETDPQAALLALVDADEPGPGWKAVGLAQVDADRTALLVHADDPRLRRLAVLDAVINNADRKGGHLLPTPDGRLYAIDHGITFAVEDKLRTLLWGWAGEPLPGEIREVLEKLRTELDGALGERLDGLLAPQEVEATRRRVAELLRTGLHPGPPDDRPAVPWPPV